MTDKTPSLEKRIFQFFDSRGDTENLDTDHKIDGERADYLVGNRALIVEIKNLKSDPSYKMDEILESLKKRSEYPLFYGTRQVEDVLAHFPDMEDIRQNIFAKITRQIEKGLKNLTIKLRQRANNLGLIQHVALFIS